MPLRVVPSRRPGLPVSRLMDQKEKLQIQGCAAAKSRRDLASSGEKISSLTSFWPIMGQRPMAIEGSMGAICSWVLVALAMARSDIFLSFEVLAPKSITMILAE